MPSYTFTNDEEEVTISCPYEELAEVVKEFKEKGWRQVYKMNIVSQSGSNLSKTDDGWKDVLRKIKKGSGRNNTIKV